MYVILNPQAPWENKKQKRIKKKATRAAFRSINFVVIISQERTKESFNQVESFIQARNICIATHGKEKILF
jgi:16S rRNA C1402 (ribose-2'-O) methylase RsmI